MNDTTRAEILERFQEIKYVGPAYAEKLYDRFDIRTWEEVVEAARADELRQLKGVGESKQESIRESAESLIEDREAGDAEETEDVEEAAETEREAEVEPSEAADEGDGEVRVHSLDREPRTAEDAGLEGGTAVEEAADEVEAGVEEAREVAEAEAEETADTAEETTRRPRIERFIERLRCPACGHDEFKRTQSTLTCQACRRDYDMQDGVVDLAPPQVRGGGLAQRVMESDTYARFYENLMRPNLTKLVSNRTMEEERELAADYLELEADSTILDVATGTGSFVRHFAKHVSRGRSAEQDASLTIGMDISWPMLEQARERLRREGLTDRIFLLRGDATRIPLGRETFDRVHCAGGLHLMDGVVDEVLRNFSRVLEPGGILVVSTFLLDGPIWKKLVKRLAGVATHFHWFERDELHDRLSRAGLEVEAESVSQEAITVKARRS